MQDNPHFQLVYGSAMVVFYVPLIVFGIYRVLAWLLEQFDGDKFPTENYQRSSTVEADECRTR